MAADPVVISSSEDETFRIARELTESLALPAHVLLYGELGAGKTAFARGLAAGFGLEDAEEVSSPTFTLVNQYHGESHGGRRGGVRIYHIDLYRVETGDLDSLGLDEIFDDPAAAVIVEWAERLGDFDVRGATRVFLEYLDDRSRRIEVFPAAL